jgi:preprotein translocase subunit Sec63
MSKSKVKEIKLGKRGYKAIVKNKKFNFGDGKHIYEVIELSGPKMDKPRIFVDEESVRKYVGDIEVETKMDKLETSLIKNVLSKKDKKEVLASKELSDMIPALEVLVDANFRDMNAKRPEDTDK